MKELNEAIRIYGRGIGKDIVKVDMFLNHRIDTGLLFRMGEELAAHFRRQRPTMVLTVEASGIPLATAAAHALGDIPLVFAKKASASNQSADQMATAPVHSYTHNTDNLIRVDRRFIPIGSRVLIVDDFLANGNAVRGLTQIVEGHRILMAWEDQSAMGDERQDATRAIMKHIGRNTMRLKRTGHTITLRLIGRPEITAARTYDDSCLCRHLGKK